MFLAEDKLMTALMLLRDDRSYAVYNLPKARAYTDVPTTTASILRQRRRWLNGGFSTTIYSLGIFCRQYKNSQMRKKHPCIGFMLFLQLLYHLILIFVQMTIALEVVISFRLLYLIEVSIGNGPFIPGLHGFGLLNIIYLV